ncbi:NAD(P)-binding protein [Lizonia empirigonia]|nr:NAD(P)-binding protein [Lizonia empirigonia]
MDPNAFTTPFQLTKSMRREIYPAIDPKNPELSAVGKTVLITGATGGIGGEVARAWALAGAKGIVLAGRNEDLLDEPASAVKAISPSTQVLALTADLTSTSDVERLFKVIDSLGAIDVLVHAAGGTTAGVVGDLDPDAWFKDYELNVKASYIVVHHYLKSCKAGTIIFLGTLGASFTFPGLSSYSGSKLALMKLAEFLGAEKPELRVFTVHPGIVAVTETNCGAVVDALTPFAKDKGIQTGGLSLYLAQKRADHLKGGFISVNWDVEKMEIHREEIKEQKLLKLGFLGARLGSDGHS